MAAKIIYWDLPWWLHWTQNKLLEAHVAARMGTAEAQPTLVTQSYSSYFWALLVCLMTKEKMNKTNVNWQ